MIRTVVFDVGETLIDETRQWADWADWLGIPRLTFFAVLGGLIERGEPHRQVFELFRPAFDVAAALAERQGAGADLDLHPADLYPDVRPCLTTLRQQGYHIGIAGNQPARNGAVLRTWDLDVDFIAASADWGVEKPSLAFFARLADLAGADPATIAYVGDRLDYDVLPARAAGMLAVFLRRGPWGFLQASHPDRSRAHIQLDTLADLPAALAADTAHAAGPALPRAYPA